MKYEEKKVDKGQRDSGGLAGKKGCYLRLHCKTCPFILKDARLAARESELSKASYVDILRLVKYKQG